MSTDDAVPKKIFSYVEASALLPQVRELTERAFVRVESLGASRLEGLTAREVQSEVSDVVMDWARDVMALGLEVKGLWLVDFDNGSGYYCWRHPEPALQYYHGYADGLRGRMRIQ